MPAVASTRSPRRPGGGRHVAEVEHPGQVAVRRQAFHRLLLGKFVARVRRDVTDRQVEAVRAIINMQARTGRSGSQLASRCPRSTDMWTFISPLPAATNSRTSSVGSVHMTSAPGSSRCGSAGSPRRAAVCAAVHAFHIAVTIYGLIDRRRRAHGPAAGRQADRRPAPAGVLGRRTGHWLRGGRAAAKVRG